MASSTPLKELEENFFLCPTCLEQFKEPKLLPCLHRHCSDCLEAVINGSNDGTIKCPMCTQQCAIPDNGIDGFKTDFHTKSVVEFIQSQKSFENKDLKECVSCSKEKHVLAYCFKCKDFLCEQCYSVHITSKMFIDHKLRALKLDDIEGRKITLDRLATNEQNPQCFTHIEENATLCCSTCANEPICRICTYTKHKGHELHDVTELAEKERKLLEVKIAELQKLKSKFYELPKTVEATKHKLNENVSKQTDKSINQHKQQINKINDILEKRRNEKVQGLADIENRREAEERQTNLSYEEDINRLNKSYEEIRETLKRKYNSEKQHLIDSFEKSESELVSKLENLDIHLKCLTEARELLTNKHKKKLTEISDNCDQIIEKYEKLTGITSSILVGNDQWTQVQCIPDMRVECKQLVEEMKKEYPKLDFLSDICVVCDMPNLVFEKITISGQEQSVVDINGLKTVGGRIYGMTSNRNGDIAISGRVSMEYSHITVINRKGEIKRQDQIKKERENDVFPDRYCCYLSEFKVATVCRPDEIGIYDVRDGSYNRKYISDCARYWSTDGLVYFLGNVSLKSHILVGTNSRYMYVFDYHLNCINTITLPYAITAVSDITVHKDTLVICDEIRKRAYAVTVDETESKVMYEFTKPDHSGSIGGPFRVCTDKNGFIYMLWRAKVRGRLTCNLAHYSQDGRQLLATRNVSNDAICLDVVEVGESEKLLIATYTSGKMYEYDITVR